MLRAGLKIPRWSVRSLRCCGSLPGTPPVDPVVVDQDKKKRIAAVRGCTISSLRSSHFRWVNEPNKATSFKMHAWSFKPCSRLQAHEFWLQIWCSTLSILTQLCSKVTYCKGNRSSNSVLESISSISIDNIWWTDRFSISFLLL